MSTGDVSTINPLSCKPSWINTYLSSAFLPRVVDHHDLFADIYGCLFAPAAIVAVRFGTDCAVCSDGYSAQFGFICRECSDSAGGIVLAVALAVVGIFAAVVVVSYVTSGERDGSGQGVVERVARYIPLQSVKIVVVAWQIVTQVRVAKAEHISWSARLPFVFVQHPGFVF